MPAKLAGLIFWLLVASLASAALVWQLNHPPRAAVNSAGQKMPELPVVEPIKPYRLPAQGKYHEIDARPLFVATRRPEPPVPEEPAAEPPPAGPEKKFLLLGVAISPGATTVLLRPEGPNAKTVRVKLGETLDGWALDKVFPNRVVIRQGQTTRELDLTRQSRPRSKAGRPGIKSGPGAVVPGAVVPGAVVPGAVAPDGVPVLPQAVTPPQPQ
ncbi:MAG: hypothetical protein JNK31_03060 [Candidatus Competibacter sp.]|nr:hypothetical protein [Candidatus Competibacter sp.]